MKNVEKCWVGRGGSYMEQNLQKQNISLEDIAVDPTEKNLFELTEMFKFNIALYLLHRIRAIMISFLFPHISVVQFMSP